MILSRHSKKILDNRSFNTYARRLSFQKALLHSSIANEVWLDIAQRDLETAMFNAPRAIEAAVREARQFSDTDIGTSLMRRACDKLSGPPSDRQQLEVDWKALSYLFAVATSSHKNPNLHRTISLCDALKAQEMVVLAGHLLRIVDNPR